MFPGTSPRGLIGIVAVKREAGGKEIEEGADFDHGLLLAVGWLGLRQTMAQSLSLALVATAG